MVITPHQFFEERALKKYFNKRGPHTSWYNYWYSQGSKDHKGDFATHRSSFYQSCYLLLEKSKSCLEEIMNRAGAQKWKQIGCDSESPLPVMRKSKRHPRVSSSKMAHSKKFNFMSQLLACIHKFNIFCHLSTLRLTLLQFVRPSRIGFRSGFCNGSQPY